MAEGELEQQHKKEVEAWIERGGVGNLEHGSLKNGFKDMAPAEVLLQNVLEKNGILKRKGDLGNAIKENDVRKSKESELKGADTGIQSEFSANQVNDLKALLQALTLISRNLPLPAPLLDEVHSISYNQHVAKWQNGGVGDGQGSHRIIPENQVSPDVTVVASNHRAFGSVQDPGLAESGIELRTTEAKDEAAAVQTLETDSTTIYAKAKDSEDCLKVEVSGGEAGNLLREFEDVVAVHRAQLMSAAALKEEKDRRVESQISYRIQELEG